VKALYLLWECERNEGSSTGWRRGRGNETRRLLQQQSRCEWMNFRGPARRTRRLSSRRSVRTWMIDKNWMHLHCRLRPIRKHAWNPRTLPTNPSRSATPRQSSWARQQSWPCDTRSSTGSWTSNRFQPVSRRLCCSKQRHPCARGEPMAEVKPFHATSRLQSASGLWTANSTGPTPWFVLSSQKRFANFGNESKLFDLHEAVGMRPTSKMNHDASGRGSCSSGRRDGWWHWL